MCAKESRRCPGWLCPGPPRGANPAHSAPSQRTMMSVSTRSEATHSQAVTRPCTSIGPSSGGPVNRAMAAEWLASTGR